MNFLITFISQNRDTANDISPVTPGSVGDEVSELVYVSVVSQKPKTDSLEFYESLKLLT